MHVRVDGHVHEQVLCADFTLASRPSGSCACTDPGLLEADQVRKGVKVVQWEPFVPTMIYMYSAYYDLFTLYSDNHYALIL